MIRTIWKDIWSEEAGHTQCHEHIWLKKGASYKVNHALCMDDRERSLTELKDYYQEGGRLIVDAQPIDAVGMRPCWRSSPWKAGFLL